MNRKLDSEIIAVNTFEAEEVVAQSPGGVQAMKSADASRRLLAK